MDSWRFIPYSTMMRHVQRTRGGARPGHEHPARKGKGAGGRARTREGRAAEGPQSQLPQPAPEPEPEQPERRESLAALDSILDEVKRGIEALSSKGGEGGGGQARKPSTRPRPGVRALRRPAIAVRTQTRRLRPSLSEQLRQVAVAADSALEGVSALREGDGPPMPGGDEGALLKTLPSAVGVGRLEG